MISPNAPIASASAPVMVPLKRALLTLGAVKSICELSTQETMAAIEDGRISHAWNIATPDAGRACVRCLALSVADLANGTRRIQPDASPNEILNLILPMGDAMPTIRSTTLQRVLLASQHHIYRLIKANLLHIAPNTTPGRGPSGSALVLRASVYEFLTARRILS